MNWYIEGHLSLDEHDNLIYGISGTQLRGCKKASGIRDGAATAQARAINVTLRPGCGRPGATIRAGIMELSHDPLKTRGEPRLYSFVLAKRRYKRSYDTVKLTVA